jgi:hypothetical protein
MVYNMEFFLKFGSIIIGIAAASVYIARFIGFVSPGSSVAMLGKEYADFGFQLALGFLVLQSQRKIIYLSKEIKALKGDAK